MQIKINPLEVANVLAHQAVMAEFLDWEGDEYLDENKLYTNGDKTEGYTMEVNLAYQRHHDYFFEILTNANMESNVERAKVAPKRDLYVTEEQAKILATVAYVYQIPEEEAIFEINGLFYYLKLK